MSAAGVQVSANVPCWGPDGTRLVADIYQPQSASKTGAPVVLLRTPYGRENHVDEGIGWAQYGLTFVVQDTRGRGDSDGVFAPYEHEAADGLTTLEWVRRQPWCSGDVFIAGGSYSAFCAWSVAVQDAHGLRGLISMVPAMGTHRTAFTNSGILNLGDHAWWWATYAEGRGERKRLVDLMLSEEPSVLAELPVVDIPRHLWVNLEHWATIVERGPGYLPPWALTRDAIGQVPVPVLHIGGWHDPFIAETLDQFTVAGCGRTPRPRQDLVVGPWTHTMDFNAGTTVGARNYGPGAMLPLGALMVDWVSEVLEGKDEGLTQLFVGGENRWRTDAWPPNVKQPVAFYATDGGALSRKLPDQPGELSFVDDPASPFPSCSQPFDVASSLNRHDAVRFMTEPLVESLTWIGEPRLVLQGASDSPTCDWVARLLELEPGGRAIYIAHGIVEASGAPGLPITVEVSLTESAVCVPRGSRLCLEVSGSYFPEHARNLHAGNRYHSTQMSRARQRVLLDGSTVLTLPVVPS